MDLGEELEFEENQPPMRVYCVEMDNLEESFARVSAEDKVEL